MLTTGCDGCCFLTSEDGRKGCSAGQMCVIQDDKAIAPGYCRLCRPHRWATRHGISDKQQLHKKAIEENGVRMDVLVFFDENHHTLADLQRTLNDNWYKPYTKKVIIVDTTGFGDRKNLAMQYLKQCSRDVQILVDSSTVHETTDQRGDTLRRVAKQVSSPFFLAISAGKIVNRFDLVATTIQQVPSRVIHWSFPFMVGATAIVPRELHSGLFITAPYKALTSSPKALPFTQQLGVEEEETRIGLSWFCQDAWLV